MKKKKTKEQMSIEESRKMLGSNLSFGAAEAYKLLRTNLGFCFTDESECKVIGVTSSMKGEGKSTTSVNIAYTMAQGGKRVLLIEADLRLPTLGKRLNIPRRPGLTNLLVGQCSGNDVIQKSGLLANLWVITAGDIPPNPAELLGSSPMAVTIKTMKDFFDVVIVDLPPVTAVTDAAIVSKLVNGLIIVVRQDYCDRGSLDEALRQLRLSGSKILGFVMTGSDMQKKNYKRYGKTYGYREYRQSKND